jgi:DNA modification methylase
MPNIKPKRKILYKAKKQTSTRSRVADQQAGYRGNVSAGHVALPFDKIICGDALHVLRTFPDHFIDLIVTSPPYADKRTNSYGGIHPHKYVHWFLPIANELKRVLKPSGSFILNIKEGVSDGERQIYVLELILALKKQGWIWTEEYIWHKKNSYPGKWPNRFRDAWEHCFHFTKEKKFAMYQETVRVPMGDWAKTRLKKLSETDKRRDESKVGSGFGKNISNWIGRQLAYPDNVLHLATESSNTNHSAAFPTSLPEWFIRLFTKPGDTILDPFLGSGSTIVAAKRTNRRYIGIEILKEFCRIAEQRVEEEPSNSGELFK